MSRSDTSPDPDASASPVMPPEQRWLLLGVLTGEITRTSDLKLRNAAPQEVEAELKRNHLPELEAAGYIEWDRETGEISKGPKFHEIEPALRSMMDAGDIPLL